MPKRIAIELNLPLEHGNAHYKLPPLSPEDAERLRSLFKLSLEAAVEQGAEISREQEAAQAKHDRLRKKHEEHMARIKPEWGES